MNQNRKEEAGSVKREKFGKLPLIVPQDPDSPAQVDSPKQMAPGLDYSIGDQNQDPRKRVATLVSLDIGFRPEGKKLTFSRLQGGSKVALRLWPHAWFSGILRVIWFCAVLYFGGVVVFRRTPLRFGIVSLAAFLVVLILTVLFAPGAMAIIVCLSLTVMVLVGSRWNSVSGPIRKPSGA